MAYKGEHGSRSVVPSGALVAYLLSAASCGTSSIGVRTYEVPHVVGPPGSQMSGTATYAAKTARDKPLADLSPAVIAPPTDVSICDVWLEVMHDKEIESDQTCIKRPGKSFAFPSPLYLRGKEDGLTDTQFNGMCQPEDGTPDDNHKHCAWSGLYRKNYPLAFKISTNSHEPLSHFAHIIRVFRNGTLVFSWKDDSVLSDLVIPGATLAARLMPFGAPMDLRIIPAGSPDDPSIDTQVSQTIDPLTSRIEVVKGVLLGPGGVGMDPAVACVSWLVSNAQSTAQQILGKTPAPLTPAPANCTAPGGSAAALHDTFTAAIQGGVQSVNQDIETEIKALGTQYGVAIENAAEKAKAALSSRVATSTLPNQLTVSKTLDEVNQLAGQGAQVFDALLASVRSVLANVKQLTTDRDAQARQLAAVTDALEQEGSVFTAFTKNPDLVSGETALDMHYGDKFQFFVLAPWHGLPIRVTRNIGADLGLETAIPILDFGGFRYQWGTGRSESFRLGAGIMYFKDEDTVAQSTVTTTGTTTTPSTASVFNVAAEASVSWFGFMMGAGYVLNDRDYNGFWDDDRIRVIVGADLLKLFANKSAELSAF
jgi:hypothetical protein